MVVPSFANTLCRLRLLQLNGFAIWSIDRRGSRRWVLMKLLMRSRRPSLMRQGVGAPARSSKRMPQQLRDGVADVLAQTVGAAGGDLVEGRAHQIAGQAADAGARGIALHHQVVGIHAAGQDLLARHQQHQLLDVAGVGRRCRTSSCRRCSIRPATAASCGRSARTRCEPLELHHQLEEAAVVLADQVGGAHDAMTARGEPANLSRRLRRIPAGPEGSSP